MKYKQTSCVLEVCIAMIYYIPKLELSLKKLFYLSKHSVPLKSVALKHMIKCVNKCLF